MKYLKCLLFLGLLELVCLLSLHSLLIRWLAEKDIVSVILAAGSHVPRTVLFVALTFILIRLLLFLILPGAILSRLGLLAFDYWLKKSHRKFDS